MISLKKIPQEFILFSFFFLLSRKKKGNRFSWHRPKLSYKIIVQNGHEQVFSLLHYKEEERGIKVIPVTITVHLIFDLLFDTWTEHYDNTEFV